MTNFQIGLEGTLLTTTTSTNINNQLKLVSATLNKTSNLKLIATIDEVATIANLQTQLNRISKQLVLNVGVNSSGNTGNSGSSTNTGTGGSSFYNSSKPNYLPQNKQISYNRIQKILNNNPNAAESIRSGFINLQQNISTVDEQGLKTINKNAQVLKSELDAANSSAKGLIHNLTSNISKFAQWYIIGNIFSSIVRSITSAVDELKEMDTLLTEISKTSGKDKSDLTDVSEQSFDVASKYGVKSSDYLSTIKEMYRAGYDNAEAMAELATMAQSAGDMTAELSNQYLIATDAAYHYSGNIEKLNAALDGQNYITNHNAVSMTDLAAATKISASQSASARVAIEEQTAAVGTMIATTQQGGEIAGRAWKGILMNLQQVSGEVDEATGEVVNAEDLTKYEKAVEALGVSMKTVKDGIVELRDPIEILEDLAVAYNALDESDSRRANLINAIGGKYRGNQLNALLTNWSTYEKMLNEYSQGTGSAMSEAEKTAASWEGRLNSLSNTWTEFIKNFVTPERIISFISSIEKLVHFLEKFVGYSGSLGSIGTTLATIFALRGKGFISYEPDTKQWLSFGAAVKETGKSFEFANLKAKGLQIGLNLASAALTAIALSLISHGINWYIEEVVKAEEKAKKAAQDLAKESAENTEQYKQEQNELNNLFKTYTNTIISTTDITQRKSELKTVQEELIATYGEEAKALDLVNQKYSENLKWKDEQNRKQAQEYIDDNKASYETAKAIEDSVNLLQKEPSKYGTATNFDLNTVYDYVYEGKINGDFKEFNKVTSLLTASGVGKWSNKLLKEAEAIAQNIGNVQIYLSEKSSFGKKANQMYIAGSLEDQLNFLERFKDVYEQSDKYDTDRAKGIQDEIDRLTNLKTVYEEVNAAKQLLSSPEISEEMQKDIDRVETISNLLQTETSTDKRIALVNEFNSLKDSLYKEAGDNSEVVTSLDALFDSIEKSVSNANITLSTELSQYSATLSKFQEETLPDILKQVDKYNSSLNLLAKGSTIPRDAMLDLLELDSSLADSFTAVAGGYTIDIQKLRDSKYELIDTNKEFIESEIEAATISLKNAQEQVKVNEAHIQTIKEMQQEAVNQGFTTIANAYNSQLEEAEQNYENSVVEAENLAGVLEVWNVLLTTFNQGLESSFDPVNDYLEYQQDKIEDIVDNLEEEKEAQEDILDNLESQKEELEEQKQLIEDIIADYETAASTVTTVLEDKIQELTDQNDELEQAYEDQIANIEERYNAEIEALQEKNDEINRSIELKKKEDELYNAKRTRVRVYSESGGWTEQTDSQAVKEKTQELQSLQRQYAIEDLENQRDKEIKALEDKKENDPRLKKYAEEIEAYEKYMEAFEKMVESYEREQNDLTAARVLGVNWHEQVLNRDTGLIQTYGQNYTSYQKQLYEDIEKEIEAKDLAIKKQQEVIDSRDTEIEHWNDFKTDLQNVVEDITGTNESYLIGLDNILINEKMSYQDRIDALAKFKKDVARLNELGDNPTIESVEKALGLIQSSDYIDGVKINNGGYSGVSASNLKKTNGYEVYYIDANNKKVSLGKFSDFTDARKRKTGHIDLLKKGNTPDSKYLKEQYNLHLDKNTPDTEFIRILNQKIRIEPYLEGGTVDYTGLAMVHGSQQRAETTFNARDSKKLYELVHKTSDLSALIANNINANLLKAFTNIKTIKAVKPDTNLAFNFYGATIQADNYESFERCMNTYLSQARMNNWVGK